MRDEDKQLQAMPRDGRAGAPDGVNSQADRRATGGGSAGAPYPNPHTGKQEGERGRFGGGALGHGGQSSIGYHGPQQLGEQEIRPGGNPNAGAKRD